MGSKLLGWLVDGPSGKCVVIPSLLSLSLVVFYPHLCVSLVSKKKPLPVSVDTTAFPAFLSLQLESAPIDKTHQELEKEEGEEWGYPSVKKRPAKTGGEREKGGEGRNLEEERNYYSGGKSANRRMFQFDSCTVSVFGIIMSPSNWISLKVRLQDTWLEPWQCRWRRRPRK